MMDAPQSDGLTFLIAVERFHAALIRLGADAPRPAPNMAGSLGSKTPDAAGEPCLGGQLLYAGELEREGRALVVAANIAGAASLAATADPAASKQAVRDGVADFLVTSLDEALRILKNEIRKREPVAVCVAAAPEAVEREMEERGVLPDLLRPGAPAAPGLAAFLHQGAQHVELGDPDQGTALLTWRADSAPALWLPKLDAIARDCLDPNDGPARRWLRTAPRYLGRLAQGMHLLRCSYAAAANLIEAFRKRVELGEIETQVEIELIRRDGSHSHRFTPPTC